MSDTPQFRTVLRGYEPAEVDATFRDLREQLARAREAAGGAGEANARSQQLANRVQQLEAQLSAKEAEPAPDTTPSFESLGARVVQILGLAEDEASELRAKAHSDADEHLKQVTTAAETAKADADRYAEEKRGAAEAEAQRILEDAKR